MANNMLNKVINNEFFFKLITVDNIEYNNVKVSIPNNNPTLFDVVASVICKFDISLNNIETASPKDYLPFIVTDYCLSITKLRYEDDNGRRISLTECDLPADCHLLLLSISGSCDIKKTENQQPKKILGSWSTISHNATGRNTNERSVFDPGNNKDNIKHLLPEKSSFTRRTYKWLSHLFSQQDTVNTTIFAPYMTKRGEAMTVQVLLYKDSQFADVEKRAKSVDPDAEERDNQVISIPIKKGTKVSAHLSFFNPNVDDNSIIVKDNDKHIVWNSNIEDITFFVYIDENFPKKILNGNVVIKLDGVPITELTFCVKVLDEQLPAYAFANVYATKFDKVFISYSHADVDRVQYISETCKAVRCKYFFDRHSLSPGDIYPEIIYKYIDNANLFILCWSKNAAESKWVDMEIKRALTNLDRRSPKLYFYPISISPKAEIPENLGAIFHFGELT